MCLENFEAYMNILLIKKSEDFHCHYVVIYVPPFIFIIET